MATQLVGRQISWSMSRNEEGHRTYKIRHLVESDTGLDGPANALQTPGLPTPGAAWLVDGDVDVYAYCRLDADVSIWKEKEGERPRYYVVEQTFSTKPNKRCSELQFEDPLLEPPKVSGSFVRYTEEFTRDRSGAPIINSAWEQVRGPQVEFDKNRPQVKVSMNLPDLDLGLLASMADTVNDAPLWGVPRRCIKLAPPSWEKKYYGLCYSYYTVNLEFDIRYETFDRNFIVLNGKWNAAGNWELVNIGSSPPDRYNPAHFIRFTDKKSDPCKVTLNGAGVPINNKVMGAISDASWTSPIIITSNAHGLVTGDIVGVSRVEGNTAANGYWVAEVLSADTFSLLAAQDDNNVQDSSGNGQYTQGGYFFNLSDTGPGRIFVEAYRESNFLLLGIPTEL
jgi:hypothetical protein